MYFAENLNNFGQFCLHFGYFSRLIWVAVFFYPVKKLIACFKKVIYSHVSFRIPSYYVLMYSLCIPFGNRGEKIHQQFEGVELEVMASIGGSSFHATAGKKSYLLVASRPTPFVHLFTGSFAFE